ncbi:MAG: hypothetical protein JW744_01835 [Candidatus Diapherotrites archaeon]|uniref:Uncharacterized protein n=1 Tax=Candidatus Iainarchaeum sp. TaxID=3101447 RepID=A0A939C4G8_9ARCH|nr:hypothetical protein [Candidatus Diapherotrites archaeon]
MIEAMLPALFVLFSITEFFGDMVFVLKIFVLLTIISFIVMHLGKGPLAIILIVGISWFVLFGAFWFFGSVYVLMMLLLFGVSGILIDFFFVGGMGGPQEQTPISHGIDLKQKRGAMMAQARGGPRRMMR